jgi:hypothetical protein
MRKVDVPGSESGQNSHLHEGHGTRLKTNRAHFAFLHWPRLEEPDPGSRNPSDLFTACNAQEQEVEKFTGKEVIQSMDRFQLFCFPLFEDEPCDPDNSGYPLRFVIARPKGNKDSKAGWRYTELLRQLKKLDETELRWLLIARWLVAEGVCIPEDFLPMGVLQRVYKRWRERVMSISPRAMHISPRDLYVWRLIKVWLPYFENLLTDFRKARKTKLGSFGALLKKGYRRDAIESALAKRSAVPATVSWLALREERESRKGMTERTLQNAFSRVEVAMRKAESELQEVEAEQSDPTPL